MIKYFIGGLTGIVLLMAAYLITLHVNGSRAEFAATEATRVQHMSENALRQDSSPAASVELSRREEMRREAMLSQARSFQHGH